MARLTPSALVPAVAAGLAVFAWFASPQPGGVLDEAAAALEAAGTVHLRSSVADITVDYERDVTLVQAPQPGVRQRLVFGDDVYDLLDDGTWLRTTGVPEVFGQDPVAQLRDVDADAEEIAEGVYRLRLAGGGGILVARDDGTPVRFVAGAGLEWELVGTGGSLDVTRPRDARTVSAAEHFRLLNEAAQESR